MATMSVPMSSFDIRVVEISQDVTFVKLGVSFANKMSFVYRLAYKAVALTYALKQTLEKQGEFIDMLNGPMGLNLSHAQLADMAEKIEHLVGLNDALLDSAAPRFPPWTELFVTLRNQRDNLESIAESYRCAADFECESLLAMALETVGV